MILEKYQIKFVKSECAGDLIDIVSCHSKTRQLKEVRDDYTLGKTDLYPI